MQPHAIFSTSTVAVAPAASPHGGDDGFDFGGELDDAPGGLGGSPAWPPRAAFPASGGAASGSDDSIDMDVEPEEPKPRPDAFAEIEEGSPATACRLPPGFATLPASAIASAAGASGAASDSAAAAASSSGAGFASGSDSGAAAGSAKAAGKRRATGTGISTASTE